MPDAGEVDQRYGCPLADLGRADEPRYGGKSAGLGELLGASIPVPPGFALGTSAFRDVVQAAGLGSLIDRRLQTLAPDDVRSVQSACAEITQAIGAAPVPAAVERQIEHGYRQLAQRTGDPSPPVAVRSSAVGEDSRTVTFAGQQETFLWVKGLPAVIGAVRGCWASLYSPTAVSYRARAGLGERTSPTPAMGVAVQLMVDALISGVMFTCNPVSGDPSTVAVNASWGLGEAVVAGEVTPDEYLLSKVTGELLRERVGAKLVEHVPAPGGAGTVRLEVPPERQTARCLSPRELEALLELASRIERHFGAHQDIEWSIARTGSWPDRLFVLQSRPVTTVRKPDKPPPARSAIALVMSTFGADRAPGGS